MTEPQTPQPAPETNSPSSSAKAESTHATTAFGQTPTATIPPKDLARAWAHGGVPGQIVPANPLQPGQVLFQFGVPQPSILQQSWQGPYPPPHAIERYERALPGFFDRIVSMA